MKTKIITICLLINLVANAVHGQISADSLLYRLKTSNNVYDIVSKFVSFGIDTKQYYRPEFIPYILKCLDTTEFISYKIEERKKELNTKADILNDEIRSILLQHIGATSQKIWKRGSIDYDIKDSICNRMYDSIVSNPAIYKVYHDSAFNVCMRRFIKNNSNHRTKIPEYAVTFAAYFPFPEVYLRIKELDNFGKKHNERRYYFSLLALGDPETQEYFDKEVGKIIKKINKVPEFVLRDLNINNSYSVKKLVEMLDVNTPIWGMGMPYTEYTNELVLYTLENWFLEYNIPYKYSKINRPNQREIKKRIPEIKLSAKLLMEYFDKQNEYWMKNMPFYKKKE